MRVFGALRERHDPDGKFCFPAAHDSNLVTLGGQAERYFRDDPPTCLIKLRQLAELLTKARRRLAVGKAARGPLVWSRFFPLPIWYA
jgi:hypothetical protein